MNWSGEFSATGGVYREIGWLPSRDAAAAAEIQILDEVLDCMFLSETFINF